MSETITVSLDDHSWLANWAYNHDGSYELCRRCKWFELDEIKFIPGLPEVTFICKVTWTQVPPKITACQQFVERRES